MKNKTILITGGSGSWGSAIVETLLKKGAGHIMVFARCESKLVALKARYPDPRVEIMLGDIRDRARLHQACAGCDMVFHLAALKHVSICENAPDEAVLTNVIGTQNVIECAAAQKVEKVIYASTDKAVSPNCAYGSSKLLGEKLMQRAAEKSEEGGTRYIIFRSGNLLGSEGSVIPMFARQIREHQSVNLTDRRMNRFFIPVLKAARLLTDAACRGRGGEIFLPLMPSLWIYDIARHMLEENGLDETCIGISGPRQGEKFDEVLATPEEARRLTRISEDLFVIGSHGPADDECGVSSVGFPIVSRDAVLDYSRAAKFLEQFDFRKEEAV